MYGNKPLDKKFNTYQTHICFAMFINHLKPPNIVTMKKFVINY